MKSDLAFKTKHFFWRFTFGTLRPCVGVCSLTKDGEHVFLGDVDGSGEECLESLEYLRANYGEAFLVAYRTPHGMHFITEKRGSLREVTVCLCGVPHIDVAFISQGLKRGYFFIETRMPIQRQVFEITGASPMRIERVA